jgi:hypothetical protein
VQLARPSKEHACIKHNPRFGITVHSIILELISVGNSKKELDLKESELELHPDAWERFERAVDTVIKSAPVHRQRSHDMRKERPASKGRVHKGKSRD